MLHLRKDTMGVIMSRKEQMAETAAHPGLNHYRIFYKEGEKSVTAKKFWARDDAAAKAELDAFVSGMKLVRPDDSREYFYGTTGYYLEDRGNGMVECFDDIREQFASWGREDTVWDRLALPFRRIWWKCGDLKHALEDFWYYLRNYSVRSGSSHQRYEQWNLYSSILDSLEFNLPRLKAGKQGVATEFCIMARKRLHEGDDGFDAEKDYAARPNSSDEEMRLAIELFDAELDSLLLHVRLYRFYSEHGIAGDTPEEKAIEAEYGKTIPYVPGTDGGIDYARLRDMTQAEWDAIWDWMKKWGETLWD